MKASEGIELIFGARKHKAVLSGSVLTYPKPGDSKLLPPNSCLDFSDPAVTFCAAKSQLSVAAAAALPRAAKKLRQLTYDNPRQQAHIQKLERHLHRLLALRARSVELVVAGQMEEAVGLFQTEQSTREAPVP